MKIEKSYQDFGGVYEVLVQRNFDITGIDGKTLMAKLKSPNRDLPEHSETRPYIKKNGDMWVLDVDDVFFVSRNVAHFNFYKDKGTGKICGGIGINRVYYYDGRSVGAHSMLSFPSGRKRDLDALREWFLSCRGEGLEIAVSGEIPEEFESISKIPDLRILK